MKGRKLRHQCTMAAQADCSYQQQLVLLMEVVCLANGHVEHVRLTLCN